MQVGAGVSVCAGGVEVSVCAGGVEVSVCAEGCGGEHACVGAGFACTQRKP